MMLHFIEDTRVKFSATIHFLRLGYEYQSLKALKLTLTLKYLLIDLKHH